MYIDLNKKKSTDDAKLKWCLSLIKICKCHFISRDITSCVPQHVINDAQLPFAKTSLVQHDGF